MNKRKRNSEGCQFTVNMKQEKFNFDFSTKSWKEDLALIVEGKELYVSKAILALVSPVFATMFESHFRERSLDEIELKEKIYDDFLEFLRSVYPSVMKPVTTGKVFKLLSLANEYQVDFLKMNCEKCLMENAKDTTSATELCKYIYYSVDFQLNQLEEKCIALFGEKKTMIELNGALKKWPLSQEIRYKIQEKLVIRMEQENKKMKKDLEGFEEMKKSYGVQKEREQFLMKEVNSAAEGVITLEIDIYRSNASEFQSSAKRFRNENWLMIARPQHYNSIKYLSVYLKFVPSHIGISCMVKCWIKLLGRDFDNVTNKVVECSETVLGYNDELAQKLFIEWNDLFFYTSNGKIILQAHILSHKPRLN